MGSLMARENGKKGLWAEKDEREGSRVACGGWGRDLGGGTGGGRME